MMAASGGWWLAVEDVCGALMDHPDGTECWRQLRQNLEAEGCEVVTLCYALEMSTPDGRLKEVVYEFLAQKTAGMELEEGPRVTVISEFIKEEFARFETWAGKDGRPPRPALEPLNRLFREI